MWSNSHASLIVPSWKSLYAFVCFSLTLNMYKVTGQFPWSSLKETDRGMSAELNVRVCVCVFVAPCLCWLENTDFVTLSARQTVTSAHVQHKQDIQDLQTCIQQLKAVRLLQLTFSACSFLSGWPATHWSGRVYGGSWAVWLAARPSPCERRVDTRWNLPSRYSLKPRVTIKPTMYVFSIQEMFVLVWFAAHSVSRFKEFCHLPQQRCLAAAQPGQFACTCTPLWSTLTSFDSLNTRCMKSFTPLLICRFSMFRWVFDC